MLKMLKKLLLKQRILFGSSAYLKLLSLNILFLNSLF
jgi:hypothetical protein